MSTEHLDDDLRGALSRLTEASEQAARLSGMTLRTDDRQMRSVALLLETAITGARAGIETARCRNAERFEFSKGEELYPCPPMKDAPEVQHG